MAGARLYSISPYQYVSCIETRIGRRGYRNTPERARIAYETAKCALEEQSLRRCSLEYSRRYRMSYRRLEDYIRYAGMASYDRYTRRWILWGKLVEIGVLVRYEAKRASNSRTFEVRGYVGHYLDEPCEYMVELEPEYWLSIILGQYSTCDSGFAGAITAMVEAGAEVEYALLDHVVGCRELDDYTMKCDFTWWCNHVYRVPLYVHPPIVYGSTIYSLKYNKLYECNPPCLVKVSRR